AGLVPACLLLAGPPAASGQGPGAPPDTAGVEYFEKKIRPLLVEHCYPCHSAEAKKKRGGLVLDTRAGIRAGGDTGAAVVPGKPDASLLLTAVRYADPRLKMPPSGRLPAAAVADLEEWVKRGAPDPRDRAAVTAARGIDVEAGRKFWAFQPPRAHPAPQVKDTAWPRGDIDRFLLARLEAKGLRPAGDA